MQRPIVYTQEQARSYDWLEGWRYAMEGDGVTAQALLGSTTAVVSGGAATATSPASLSVNVAALTFLQLNYVDATNYGNLSADTSLIIQMGVLPASVVTLVTSGLTSGQSQWALIQATLTIVDEIPSNDPNSGLLLYYNSSDPSQPYQGPNNSGQTQNTRRRPTVTLSVVYGTASATGSEVPPNASAGSVGLYLIDLTYGQTQITTILTAGPSVGLNVPSNYPYAPLLAGLLASHHDGNPGQAPKINLTNGAEVQGVLPIANLPSLPVGRMSNSTLSALSAGVNSKVFLDTVDHTTALITTDTVNHRITATIAGYYLVGGSVSFTAPGAATTFAVTLEKNGSSTQQSIINTASSAELDVTDVMHLNVGDYVELWAESSAVSVNAGIGSNLRAVFVSP